MKIGIIGDHDPGVTAHRAIPRALALAAQELGVEVDPIWIGTETIGPDAGERLSSFDGFWCVPATPYRSEEGALRAIRFARVEKRPFLGTCGGFQHALLEYARNVLGRPEAGHAESDPATTLPLIAPLACSLVEKSGAILLEEGTSIRRLYGVPRIVEEYHCSYGLNPSCEALLQGEDLRISARDEQGEVRAAELLGHPFFLGTLFQPERSALRGVVPPLARGFLASVQSS